MGIINVNTATMYISLCLFLLVLAQLVAVSGEIVADTNLEKETKNADSISGIEALRNLRARARSRKRGKGHKGGKGISRPNVLLFISDDLRADIAPYRQDMAPVTPNLAEFASNSLTFANAYVQMATCGPSRNSFLTGRRSDNLRSWNFLDNVRKRSRNVVTLPQLFKIQGYESFSFGKVMHVYPGLQDDPISWTSIVLPSHHDEQDCPAQPGGPWAWCECNGKDLTCVDKAIATAAIKTLQDPKRLRTPFFMGVGFRRPHLDFISPKGYAEFEEPPFNNTPEVRTAPNYDQSGGMPNIAFPFCDDADARQPFLSVSDRLKPWTVYDDSIYSTYRREYFRTVAFMDEQLGRVLSALDAIPQLRDNTIVMFISDNGKGVGERNHFCKNGLFEVDTRVPMIMRLPASIADKVSGGSSAWKGGVVKDDVELLDLYRTVTSLAGATNPTCLKEGRDLTPYFADPSSQPFIPLETLLSIDSPDFSSLNVSQYSFALSQIPRCNVGYGTSNPCTMMPSNQFMVMGYSLKTTNWRYTEWRVWNPKTNEVDWSPAGLNATELYSHDAAEVHLPELNFDKFENENVNLDHQSDLIPKFSAILQWLVKSSFAMYPSSCQPKA